MMRTIARIALLVMGLALLSGCKISGTIGQADGTPVAGVTVQLSGPVFMETTTDASGRYVFYNNAIINAEFNVTPLADAYDFEPESRQVVVAERDVSHVDFTAIPRKPCQTNDACDAKAYCKKKVGDCDGDGYCAPRPDYYIRLWAPICGCDGQTHACAHNAAVDGVNVLHVGECGTTTPGEITELQSDLERDTTPDVSTTDVAALVTSNTEFAVGLYQRLSEAQGNLFYSPHSISTALAMLYAGAANETERQMAACLHFNLPQETLHAAFNYLALALESRGQGAAGADGGEFRLNIANSIWLQQNLTLLPAYLDILAVQYGAGTRLLDFSLYPEESRQAINQWVAEQTEERIQDLLPQGSITPDTRLVLTNAVYFNAAWLHPFETSQTSEAPFYLLDQGTVRVPTMRQTEYLRHASGTGFQAVELPYDGNELSMVILVPGSGAFKAFEAALDSQTLSTILGQLRTTYVDISLPQWEYTSEFALAGTLAAMGMTDAFDPSAADFSGINGSRDLFVQGVVHKAFVKVNEAGTEAAAATGVIVGTTSMPPPPLVLKIDRPFIYLIRDIQTKAILFVGRVLNPA